VDGIYVKKEASARIEEVAATLEAVPPVWDARGPPKLYERIIESP
jgi:hypothetical protein